MEALVRTLKRAMAAEYSLNVSGKVFTSHCRLARSGFKLGGSAGYVRRRLPLYSEIGPKLILGTRERESRGDREASLHFGA